VHRKLLVERSRAPEGAVDDLVGIRVTPSVFKAKMFAR